MNVLRMVGVCVVVGWAAAARAGEGEPLKPVELTVDGVARSALVYAPAQAASKRPLVFVFHGHGGSAQQVARQFRVEQLWPEAIVVYPQGLDTPGKLTDPGGTRAGWQHGPGDMGDRDLRFFDALLARVRQDQAVGDDHVFCTGHSNGGGFTYLLWRSRGPTFAAVAPSAAAAGYAAQLSPKPAMILGGKNDPLVQFAWQQRTMEVVRRLDRCDAKGEPWGHNATVYGSSSGTPVVTYVHDGGHRMTAEEPAMIVRFFQSRMTPTTQPTTRPGATDANR